MSTWRWWLGIAMITALSGPCFIPVTAGSQERISAAAILDRIDDLYRSRSSRGEMIMSITTSHWKRTLILEFWSKGKDRSLVRIKAPKKERGVATLRSGNDIWNYLPKVKRVIKLPASMMSASWMGSHFTNDDLVKESRFTEDYDFRITNRNMNKELPCIEITCLPKPQAAVVWGKVIAVVGADDLLPLEIRYYDEDMKLIRTLTFSDVREIGARRLPMHLVVVPTDKPGERTDVIYTRIEFDIDLADDLFSLRSLRR